MPVPGTSASIDGVLDHHAGVLRAAAGPPGRRIAAIDLLPGPIPPR